MSVCDRWKILLVKKHSKFKTKHVGIKYEHLNVNNLFFLVECIAIVKPRY
jgi:hypothetical protein